MTDGSTIEVGMIGREGMVGVPTLLGVAVSTQHIIVQIPGTALKMPAAQCKAAFDQSLAVRAPILRFIQSLLDLSAQTAACNRLHSVERRFARWLLMAHAPAANGPLPMTHQSLPTLLGGRRARVAD